MAQSNIIVKLSLKDAEVVRAGLQSVGSEGERALKRIEAAARAPSPALKALAATSHEIKGKLGGLSSEAGAFGTALRTLGPAGLAAAAGVGAIVVALGAAMAKAREVTEHFDRLADQAARVGLSAEAFQELVFAFGQWGVKADEAEAMLSKLNDTLGDVLEKGADTPKEVATAFSKLGISLEDVRQSGGDLNVILPKIAEGMRDLGTQAERTAVAKTLFGRAGAALIPILMGGAQALDDSRQKAHALGAVLGDDLVARYSEFGDRLDAVGQIMQTQAGRIFPEMAEGTTEFAETVGTLTTKIADLLDAARQELGDNVFSEIAQWAFSALKPLQEALGLINNLLDRWQQWRRGQHGATGSWEPDDGRTGSWGDELPSPVARPGRPSTPRRGFWPDSGGDGGRGGGRAGRTGGGKAPEYVDIVTGRAITPTEDQLYFSAHPPKPRTVADLEAFEKSADAIEKRNQQLMDSLQRAWLQASGERIALIEFDRDAQLKALDEQDLNEQQHADAAMLINRTSAREIADERQRMVDSIKDPAELGASSVFSLTDAFKQMGVAASSAFEDAIAGGKGFSEILQGLATDLEKLLIRKFASEPLMKLLDAGIGAAGNAFTQWQTGYGSHTVSADWTNLKGLKAAHGAAFEGGNVVPFARGGLIERPTLFPMAHGYGLMGEAGPEAVLPLKRLPSGRLGVEAGGGPQVTVNVINNAGAKVSTEQKRDDRGGLTIDVMIDAVEQAMASRATRPGTTLNRALAAAANPVRAR